MSFLLKKATTFVIRDKFRFDDMGIKLVDAVSHVLVPACMNEILNGKFSLKVVSALSQLSQ